MSLLLSLRHHRQMFSVISRDVSQLPAYVSKVFAYTGKGKPHEGQGDPI